MPTWSSAGSPQVSISTDDSPKGNKCLNQPRKLLLKRHNNWFCGAPGTTKQLLITYLCLAAMTAGVSIKQHEGKTKVLTWEQTSHRKTCSRLHLYAINRWNCKDHFQFRARCWFSGIHSLNSICHWWTVSKMQNVLHMKHHRLWIIYSGVLAWAQKQNWGPRGTGEQVFRIQFFNS